MVVPFFEAQFCWLSPASGHRHPNIVESCPFWWCQWKLHNFSLSTKLKAHLTINFQTKTFVGLLLMSHRQTITRLRCIANGYAWMNGRKVVYKIFLHEIMYRNLALKIGARGARCAKEKNDIYGLHWKWRQSELPVKREQCSSPAPPNTAQHLSPIHILFEARMTSIACYWSAKFFHAIKSRNENKARVG